MSVRLWESYYRTGALATCPTSPTGAFDLEVRDVWVQFFSTLRDGASILEIGCGNGIVALIAKETAAALGRSWTIHASDLATTDPARCVEGGAGLFAGIEFHPGVAAERLPFDDGRFDAVCGHFALEYMDAPAALAQAHRVLRPGSDAQFVVGHADSTFVRSARTSVREGELVFNETKVFKRLKRLVGMERVIPGTTETVTSELQESIRTLKQAHGIARQAGGGRIIGVALDSVQRLLELRREGGAQRAALEVDRAEAHLREAVARLRDVIEHGLAEDAMDTLQRDAENAGFSLIERLPLYHGGSNLLGWQLVMHRG